MQKKKGVSIQEGEEIKKMIKTRKQAFRQIGITNKIKDMRLKAMHPGKRISKYGNVYYERRKNRTDKGVRL